MSDAEVVVQSNAVTEDNPEILAARERGIPVILRSAMLNQLMRLKYGIGIAGTHGKTTVTNMTAKILGEGRLDPTVILGGRLSSPGSHARLGSGEYIVAEACEAFGSFLDLHPTIALATNVEDDHLDHYGTLTAVQAAFRSYLERVPFYGTAIVCWDDPFLRKLAKDLKVRKVSYGLEAGADVSAEGLERSPEGCSFQLVQNGRKLGFVDLKVPGRHNVQNALGAAAVALEVGVEPEAVARGLAAFRGTARRFELKGEVAGIKVVDDYGHHPTEVAATLKAARDCCRGRVLAVFQPHLYSRTRDHAEGFGRALALADTALILPIYPAREKPIPGVTQDWLLDMARRAAGGKGRFVAVGSLEEAAMSAVSEAVSGDMILTIGAGDIHKAAGLVLENLSAKTASTPQGVRA